MSEQEKTGLSRRDFLKRGAALGGAVVWATPVVQIVGMRPALAQDPSPACSVWYAVKIDPSGGDPQTHCVDISGQNDPKGGQCLNVDDSPQTVESGGCDHIVSSDTPDDSDWVITLDESCQFEAGDKQCFVKAGTECHEGTCVWDPDAHTLTFPQPGVNSISHVEFIFCCAE